MNLSNFGSANFIPNLVIGIAVLFLILLALRELRTWYWKINDIVALLKKIEENTRKGGVPAASPIIDSPIAVQAEEMAEQVPSFKTKKPIDPKIIRSIGRVLFTGAVFIALYFLATSMTSFIKRGTW